VPESSTSYFNRLEGMEMRRNMRYRKEFIFGVTDGFFVGEILDQSLDLYIDGMVETG